MGRHSHSSHHSSGHHSSSHHSSSHSRHLNEHSDGSSGHHSDGDGTGKNKTEDANTEINFLNGEVIAIPALKTTLK